VNPIHNLVRGGSAQLGEATFVEHCQPEAPRCARSQGGAFWQGISSAGILPAVVSACRARGAGETLRLRSGQAPSTSLRAGCPP